MDAIIYHITETTEKTYWPVLPCVVTTSSALLHNSLGRQRWSTMSPVLPPGGKKAKCQNANVSIGTREEGFDICFIFPNEGSGPVLEILQDEVNPR